MEPCYIVEEKDTKKLLFKKRSTSSTCAVSAVQPFFSLCKVGLININALVVLYAINICIV